MQRTFFERAKSIVGTVLVGLGIFILHENLDRTATQLRNLHGDAPISTLASDAQGNPHGTTSDGGSTQCNCSTIFKISPNTGGGWTESVVYRFPGSTKPGFAYNGMVPNGKGSFYGATVHGGAVNDGAIYQFTP